MSFKLQALLAISFAAFLIGCGPGNPPTATVTGKVTYKGEPVEGARITFAPDAAEASPANGKTEADGSFSLSTFAPGDGAMTGTYKVAIKKEQMDESGAGAHSESGEVPQASDEVKHLLPKKYSRIETTDLTAEVKDTGDNNFVFELKD